MNKFYPIIIERIKKTDGADLYLNMKYPSFFCFMGRPGYESIKDIPIDKPSKIRIGERFSRGGHQGGIDAARDFESTGDFRIITNE